MEDFPTIESPIRMTLNCFAADIVALLMDDVDAFDYLFKIDNY
jgi:hypothetical protein